MKMKCKVIEDILPLVVEELSSSETREVVMEHLKECPNCRKEYEELKNSQIDHNNSIDMEDVGLEKVKKKIKNKNIYIGILSSLIIGLLFLLTLNLLTKPISMSYEKAIDNIKLEKDKIYIKFNKDVAYYSIVSTSYGYEIMAWKTKIYSILDEKEEKNTLIKLENNKKQVVRYVNQSDKLDKIIYGQEEGNSITLARLAINYYLLIMIGTFLITSVLSFILRKRKNFIKEIFNYIMIFSLS